MSGEPARWTQAELDAYYKRIQGDLNACVPPSPAITIKSILPRARKMNAVETAWSQELDRRGVKWRWEAITLRLANDCRYTPDFSASYERIGKIDYRLIRTRFYEVKRAWKGKKRPHIFDDARVKLLVAAKEYPEFDFWLVWMDDQKEFHEEKVNG
jgi:hypothetical protein